MSKISRFVYRNSLAARKGLWRMMNSYAPNAKPLFILGAQRSGTTMLIDCLERSAEIDVLGESSTAMENFRIVDNKTLRKIITTSKHKAIVFKPLTDSHRAREFLSLSPNSVAIWAFRRVADRANSAVAKFGDHNLKVLTDISNGVNLDIWQAQGLTTESLDLIKSFDYSKMSPHDAAALFWYVRNSLYFSNGLDQLDSVVPLAYEDLVLHPREIMRQVCDLIECDFSDYLVQKVHANSIGRAESNISAEMEALCAPMYDRLHGLQKARWGSVK